ncbi:MAG: LA_2272 family surface repeat-containing protein [Kiritimatiellia bacterium]
MNKLLAFALVAAVAMPLFAQEPELADPQLAKSERVKRESNVWPAFFAVSEFPASADVIGLRLTIPFSTKQENVTGLDLGLWGRSLYFQGFQFNVIRNDVKDDMSGFQVGCYNSIGSGQLLGLQAGLFNEACTLRGIQAGLVNMSREVSGFQIGIINRAETMVGYQVGLINVICDAELQFCPVLNIGF